MFTGEKVVSPLTVQPAFIGEGQEWTKYQTLQVDGAKLKRTERDPLASFTYARC